VLDEPNANLDDEGENALVLAVQGLKAQGKTVVLISHRPGIVSVADRLLIDAPCSGLGTLRRQPDLKWRLKPAQLERVRSIQKELLASYPAMLKPGGRLVYATCSILPSENRAAVDSILAGGGYELIEERIISPARDGFDGFYAAALTKR
jgi:16S rRNA (cytosine967-C5)-methyltransferase